jgi:hypothetical protein
MNWLASETDRAGLDIFAKVAREQASARIIAEIQRVFRKPTGPGVTDARRPALRLVWSRQRHKE